MDPEQKGDGRDRHSSWTNPGKTCWKINWDIFKIRIYLSIISLSQAIQTGSDQEHSTQQSQGKIYMKCGSRGNHLLGYGKAKLVVCDQLSSGFWFHDLQDTHRLRFCFAYKSHQHKSHFSLIDSLFNLRDGGGSSGGYKRSNSQYSLKAETTITSSRLVVDRERKKQVMDDSTTVLPSQLERQNCH